MNLAITQQKSFNKLKELLSSTPVLALYDPNAETVVWTDASSHRLKAVLLQEQGDGAVKLVSCIPRSLCPTEERCMQITREVITCVCGQFSDFFVNLRFKMETDHKPLIPLFSTLHLEQLPVRVQHFILHMIWFDFDIIYISEKKLGHSGWCF